MVSKIIRIRIKIDPDWVVMAQVWQKDIDHAPVLFTHAMDKIQDPDGGFFPAIANPLPAANPTLAALLAGDAAVFSQVYASVLKRKSENLLVFGQYLFEVLIGKQNWDQLLGLPEVKAADLVEFALTWDRLDNNLHRLNWELMAENGNFLVVHPLKKVAFTRVVEGTTRLEAAPAVCPPRMLFVVGTDLDDPSIRPGAEFLALVRQMEGTTGGCTLQSHLILRASIDSLVDTVSWYQPDVVYFICHGNIDKSQGSFLYLLDKDQANKVPVYSDQLADALRSANKLPGLVILNACYTGQTVSMGGPNSSPLAAGLVNAGIPVVIAMAGRVSDNTCRLFTRMCGEALMEGERVTIAAARGRRSAHLEGGSMTRSVDWAFPTIFMAESIGPDFRPVDPDTVDSARKIEDRLKKLPLRAQTDRAIFCGREEFLSAYYRMFQAGGPHVLGCQVAGDFHGYGKSRLLKEFAARAVRDQRAPCLLLPVLNGTRKLAPPQNPGMLAYRILETSGDTRNALGLNPPQNSEVLSLIQANAASPLPASLQFKNFAGFYDFLEKVKESDAALIGSKSAGEALRSDLSQLAKEAGTGVLLLLDDVHLYDQALAALLQDWITGFGLGDELNPVPVIMTFARNTPAEQYLKDFIEASNPHDVVMLNLGPFSSEGKDPLFSEDILAYERTFLHHVIRTLPPLAINPDALQGIVQKSVSRFRKYIKGIPMNLTSDNMELLGEDCKGDEFLIEADDDRTIQRMDELGLL